MTDLMQHGYKSLAALVVAAFACVVIAAPVSAQGAPAAGTPENETTQEQTATDAASAAAADVAATQAAVAPPPPPAATTEATVAAVQPNAKVDKDQQKWTISAGGNVARGNANTEAYNAGSDYLWSRAAHQVTTGINYNQAFVNRGKTHSDTTLNRRATAQNFSFKAQYDWFFTKRDALWVSVGGRTDKFAALKFGVRIEGGYLRQWLNTESQWLNSRIGYSFTNEHYYDQPIVPTPATAPFSTSFDAQSIHGLLLATDYKWTISSDLGLRAGVMGIFNMNELKSPAPANAFEDARIFAYTGLTAQLFKRLGFNIDYKFTYDNVPVPGKVKSDHSTIFSLAYTLL